MERSNNEARWEIFSGCVPFTSYNNEKRLIAAILGGKRPEPMPLNIPEELKQVIEISWSEDPLTRPSSKELLSKLTEIRDRTPQGEIILTKITGQSCLCISRKFKILRLCTSRIFQLLCYMKTTHLFNFSQQIGSVLLPNFHR